MSYIKSLIILLIIIFSSTNLKKKRPKLSVFIPIYNCEKYINKCIKSVQNQTLKDIEIIVVNDHSNDNSSQKIQAHQQNSNSKYLKFLVFLNLLFFNGYLN